jgi:hypothetical protein
MDFGQTSNSSVPETHKRKFQNYENKTENIPPVNRTVILLDCYQQNKEQFCSKPVDIQFSIPAYAPQTIQSSSTSNPTETFKFSFNRTVLSSCIEAVADYSRIVFDLFPDQSSVRICP